MEKELMELMKKVLSDEGYFDLKISVDEITTSTRFNEDLGMNDEDKDVMGYYMEDDSKFIISDNSIEKSETVGDFILLVSAEN